MKIHVNTILHVETVDTGDTCTCKYKIVWRDRERPKETKETVETVEMGDTCKYKVKRERPKKTKETAGTVETNEDTCKYKIVWRDRGETKGD